jgi:hypothetical protein
MGPSAKALGKRKADDEAIGPDAGGAKRARHTAGFSLLADSARGEASPAQRLPTLDPESPEARYYQACIAACRAESQFLRAGGSARKAQLLRNLAIFDTAPGFEAGEEMLPERIQDAHRIDGH